MKLEKTNNFFDVIENSAPPIDFFGVIHRHPARVGLCVAGHDNRNGGQYRCTGGRW